MGDRYEPPAPDSARRAAPGLLRRLASSVPLRLALIAFVVYNANLRSITSFDTYPTRLLPVAVLTEGNLHLDQFPFLREPRFAGEQADSTPYFMTRVRGHWLSRYPIAPALLATPVYALPIALGIHRGRPLAAGVTRVEVVATLLSKLAASLALALSVALMYAMLRRLTRPRSALALSLLYAFATSSWSVSSQGLWQTAFAQPMLALALYALVRARQETAPARWIALAGLALALAVSCRPPMVLVAAVLSVYVLWQFPRQVPAFAAAPLVVGGLLLWYNLYYFGALTGGYGDLAGSHDLSTLRVGLPGILVSPNRGLLVFTPILAPAFVGMALAMTRRSREREPLLPYVAVATLIAIVQYATFSIWYAAFSFSYRFLAEMLPALVLLLLPVWDWLVATPARRAMLGVAVAWSVGVQIVGAFYYPCGWYRTPAHDPTFPARYFDWGDMELVQCVRAGPVDPDGLRAIRGALGIPGGGRVAQ